MDACNIIEGVKNIAVSIKYGLSYDIDNYDNLVQHYKENLDCVTDEIPCDTSEAVCGEIDRSSTLSGFRTYYLFVLSASSWENNGYIFPNDIANMRIIIPNQI